MHVGPQTILKTRRRRRRKTSTHTYSHTHTPLYASHVRSEIMKRPISFFVCTCGQSVSIYNSLFCTSMKHTEVKTGDKYCFISYCFISYIFNDLLLMLKTKNPTVFTKKNANIYVYILFIIIRPLFDLQFYSTGENIVIRLISCTLCFTRLKL